jgi:hypothetical protein
MKRKELFQYEAIPCMGKDACLPLARSNRTMRIFLQIKSGIISGQGLPEGIILS